MPKELREGFTAKVTSHPDLRVGVGKTILGIKIWEVPGTAFGTQYPPSAR